MAIAIPAQTTAYLTALKAALRAGSDLNPPTSTITAPGRNYLEAMDMANVLEMLQENLSDGATLTASGGGTTTTLVDAANFIAGTMVGNTVTFDAATATVALRGLTRKVIANTTGALTFDEPLPAVTAIGETYSFSVDLVDAAVSDLRDGSTARGSAPRGNVYGMSRVVTGALLAMAEQLAVTSTAYQPLVNAGTLGAAVGVTVLALDIRGAKVPGDFFVGMIVTDTGGADNRPRRIVSSDEDGRVTVAKEYAVAPGANTYTVVHPLDGLAPGLQSKDTHPGAHAGGNTRLAEFIEQVETAIAAHTLPS